MKEPVIEIKRVSSTDKECLNVIHNAFITVARDFNLTSANAPTNPAFMSLDDFKKMDNENTFMYSALIDDKYVGFIAIWHQSNKVCWLQKVAVIPDFRSRGIGTKLVDFALDTIFEKGNKEVKIGIIDENKILKNWYLEYGFKVVECLEFNHLPFTVCIMNYKRKSDSNI